MTNRNHIRSASFDITSLHYYYSHCQPPPPPLLDENESQFTKENCNNSTLRKSHSVHELPSQLEFQIELKVTRRLKLMKEEGGANNNDEVVVVGGGCVVEMECCNETESDEEFIGEVEDDEESIGEQHYVEDDFTEDELVRNLLRRQPVVEQPQPQQCTLQEESESNNDECTTNDYESLFLEWRRTTDCSEDTPRVGNVSSHLLVGVVDGGMECCNEIEVERAAAESDNGDNEASSRQDRIENQLSSSSQILSDDIRMPPTINKKNARHGLICEMVGGGDAETKSDMEADLSEDKKGKNGGIAGKIGSGGDMTFSTGTNTITANSSRLGAQDVVAAKSESDDVGDSRSNQYQEQRNDEHLPSPQPTTDDDMMQSPMEEKRNVRHGLIRQIMVGSEEKQQEKKGDEGDEEDKKGNGQVRMTKEAMSGSDDIPLLSATTNTTISSRTSTATTTTSVATTSHISTKTNNNNKMDVLTEGQYFLSISMLVYMYSHLRETCRMGHTRVKMEEIDCNNSILGVRSGLQQQQCSSPVRMFSSLMESMHSMGSSSPLQQSQQSSYLSNNNNNTLTAGAIIRVVIDELEDYDKEQHMNDYYYQANSHHQEYEESIMKEFRQWIEESRVSQLDSSTQDLIASLRKKVAKARWKRAMTVMRVTRATSRRFSDNDDNDVVLTDDGTKNPNKEQMVHYLRRQVARYRWKRVIAKVRLAVRLGGGICPKFDSNIAGNGEGNRYVNMNKLLKKGLENDPKYFMDGSVMSNLIESSLEVVWFSDFTQNDVVYGICVQREEKKITVVFRGTVNAHNWSMNLRYDMMEIPNPVEDYYPGRAETLNLHCGFALYLLRRRKDTRRSKMDEIFEKIEQIGKELAPGGDYKLCITGHSMGGALATLFGFFLGAKLSQSQQTKSQEILIYTFASPRVGGESFIYAYQHLERAGLIRHARFSCTNDIVPLIPFSNLKPDDLKFYKHVGMRIQLHNTGPINKWRLRRRLDVSYPLCHDWSSTIARGLMNCIFGNPNTPRGYKLYHTVTEYQTRLHFALTYRKALASTVFFLDERRQRLKSLDEYYAFRGTMNINVYSYMLVPRTDGLNIRKRVTKVVLVIPLMYTWTRLLSVVTSAEIIIPKIVHWVFIEQLPKVAVVAAVPFLLMLQYLLILSLGLAFIIEVIKLAIKIPNIRWGGFKKMSGRLILVAPLLNVWVKFFVRLTNVTIPKNFRRLILQQLFNLWKLVPFVLGIIYKLLQLSFGLSFVMVALGISIRARSNRWRRSLGKMLLATIMLVAWVYLFSAAYKNMVSDDLAARISNANNPGWGLAIEANAAISKNFRRLILQQLFNLWKLVPFVLGIIYKLLQLSFGLSFVMVALGISIRARSNRWRRSLGKMLLATIMLVAWVYLFSAAYKNMVSDDLAARISNANNPGWGLAIEANAAISKNFRRLILQQLFNLWQLVPFFFSPIYKLLQLSFGLSFVVVALRTNRWRRTLGKFLLATIMLAAWVFLFSSAYKKMASDDPSATGSNPIKPGWGINVDNQRGFEHLGNTSSVLNVDDMSNVTNIDAAKIESKLTIVQEQLQSIQEYATGIKFAPTLDNGLYLVGAGVRKKSVIKVYAVAIYSTPNVLDSASSSTTLHDAARTFDSTSSMTTFVLEMVYSAGQKRLLELLPRVSSHDTTVQLLTLVC
ncbi:lipase class 3 family protein [Skeletonema marinoi]|uniref:Lipase class 3 family protein n=1 Tax=Skeletonema marinoi TaxID=267567 RepID=A0AAD8XTH9_9STRA|nr:lipase class 3 family protein [Skeletonema marinoi]